MEKLKLMHELLSCSQYTIFPSLGALGYFIEQR